MGLLSFWRASALSSIGKRISAAAVSAFHGQAGGCRKSVMEISYREAMRLSRPLLASLFVCTAIPALAAEPEGASLAIVTENDNYSLQYKDRHYTNGIYAAWTSPPSEGGDWYARLANDVLMPDPLETASFRHTFYLGQSIFTPGDLSRNPPNPKDRPYAGWLYGGVKIYRETYARLDRLNATFGVVGPWSLGNEVQVWIHSMNPAGTTKPRGWSQQIHNEPGFVLSEQRVWRSLTLPIGNLEAEALPEASLAFGNILTYAGAGLSLRLGQNLDADWGPPAIAPSLEGTDFAHKVPFAWYVFAGVEGRAIGRNIFLDGNLFRNSASIAKEPFVGDFRAGVGLLMNGINLYATYTIRSHEFKAQKSDDRFAAVAVSFTN
jgi:hypothetical protein